MLTMTVKGLVIMAFDGAADFGGHCVLAPAYNITKEQVEKIVDIFVESVEELLRENAQ